MREADALESLTSRDAKGRSEANLRQYRRDGDGDGDGDDLAGCRNSDDRAKRTEKIGRTDATIARAIGLGGKDLYRQARAIWNASRSGDARAQSSLAQLDGGTKTVYSAYKDLRRRDRYSAGFRPTPYDVWPFKHDRAFGIPHPGSIPPGVVAHTLHYFTEPDANWSSTRWRAAARHSTSASRWDAGVSRMTFTLYVRKSNI